MKLFAAPGVDRPPERGGVPGGRDPRPDRRPDRPAEPRHVRGLPGHVRPRRHAVRPDHARPRRLPRDQQQRLGTRPATRSCAASRRRSCGPGRDTDLVFRYGGDEFAFLLPNSDPAARWQVAERAARGGQGPRRPGHRIDRGGHATRPTGRRRPRSCSPPTGPASSPSAPAETAWPAPPRASASRPSSGSRHRRRSTPRRPPPAADTPEFAGVRHDDPEMTGPRHRPAAPADRPAPDAGLASGCIPAPVGQASPTPIAGSNALAPRSPRPTAAPTGPSPSPSFVRPVPTAPPTFQSYVVKAGDTLVVDRQGTRDHGAQPRVLESDEVSIARSRRGVVRPESHRDRLGAPVRPRHRDRRGRHLPGADPDARRGADPVGRGQEPG